MCACVPRMGGLHLLWILLTVHHRGDEAPPRRDSGKITAVIPALADWGWICGVQKNDVIDLFSGSVHSHYGAYQSDSSSI